MATTAASTSDNTKAKQNCLGCLAFLVIVVVIGVLVAAVCGSEPEPRESPRPPAQVRTVEAGSPTVLTVGAGGPTVRVEIEQKISHGELRRIARIMRERWKDGQGEFAVPSRGARQDLAWREVQLRVATTFVFFYLPGMDIERDNAWARVTIPPDGTAEVTIISL